MNAQITRFSHIVSNLNNIISAYRHFVNTQDSDRDLSSFDLNIYENKVCESVKQQKITDTSHLVFNNIPWQKEDIAFFIDIQQTSDFKSLPSYFQTDFQAHFFKTSLSSMDFFNKAKKELPDNLKTSYSTYIIQQFNEGTIQAHKDILYDIINDYDCILAASTIRKFLQNEQCEAVNVIMDHPKSQWFISLTDVKQKIVSMAFKVQNSEFMEFLYNKYPEIDKNYESFFTSLEDLEHLSHMKGKFLSYFLDTFKPDYNFVEPYMPYMLKNQNEEKWWILVTHYVEEKDVRSLEIISESIEHSNGNKIEFMEDLQRTIKSASLHIKIDNSLIIKEVSSNKKVKV